MVQFFGLVFFRCSQLEIFLPTPLHPGQWVSIKAGKIINKQQDMAKLQKEKAIKLNRITV